MVRKQKKCKGTGKATNNGCNEITYIYRYGLCMNCFKIWLYNTDEGAKLIKKTVLKVKKEKKPKKTYVKWENKDYNDLIKYLQFEIVNPYIRLRDITVYNRCISSNNSIVDAGHYIPTTYTKLRFCCQNIHGQNHSDNRFKGGNLHAYKIGLINRFGEKYLSELEKLKIDSNNWPKFDRIELIKIGNTYKWLFKNKVWVFRHEEFENYKNLINK